MSTTINWKTLDDKEQTRLIIEHVLDYFIMPDDACKRGRLEITNPVPEGFHWPVAYWNDDGEWWFTRDIATHQRPFDPLRDMNDAWLIIEKLETTATLNYTPGFAQQESGGQSAHYECKLIELDILGGNDKIARAIANTPVEAICVAALRWVGIQVTHTIEAMPCWEVTFEDGETLICKNKHDAEQVLSQREQYLKDNLQWAVNIRKLKIAEVMVPEDYFNGPVIG